MGIRRIFSKLIDKVLYNLRYKIYHIIQNVEYEQKEKNKNNILINIPLVGEKLKINGEIQITHPQNVIIGSNVHIGNNAYFNTLGGLIIGDNVHISRNVTIYTSSHNYHDALPYDHKLITKSVIIKKNVWIGMNVNITPGVTIEEGAIIGQGACITKNVPAYAIVGNQQYRLIKYRNIDKYKELEEKEIYGGVNGKIIKRVEAQYKSGEELGENLFFIVSTGRSGTSSLADILNQDYRIVCKHEVSNILISLSTLYEHNEICEENATSIIKEIYCRNKIYKTQLLWGESNQKLSNLIPILHKAVPKAKFIWLMRDGKKVVDSTYGRGWYSNEKINQDIYYDSELMIWDNYRLLGYKTGDYNIDEWNKLTVFEKNCWYWYKWNSIIEKNITQLPKDQKLIIRLEDLNDKIQIISEFLGVPDNNFKIVKKNQAKTPLKGIENWDNDEIKQFDQICGKLYRKYYG